MSDKQPKAWTDEEISAFANNAPSAWEARRLYDAMRKVRDDLYAEIAALRTELAQARAWSPLPDGFYYNDADMSYIRLKDGYFQAGDSENPGVAIVLRGDIRVFRRAATAPGTAAQEDGRER